jgi:four helix bundle protein
MAGARRFEDIKAWQKARELVREAYSACSDGQLSKDYGLRDQLRRAAVSSMTNVAEGFGRRSGRDFAHFLDIARGSAIEVQSLLYVALDVRYIDRPDFDRLYQLCDETIAVIAGLTAYLRRDPTYGLRTPNSELRTET